MYIHKSFFNANPGLFNWKRYIKEISELMKKMHFKNRSIIKEKHNYKNSVLFTFVEDLVFAISQMEVKNKLMREDLKNYAVEVFGSEKNVKKALGIISIPQLRNNRAMTIPVKFSRNSDGQIHVIHTKIDSALFLWAAWNRDSISKKHYLNCISINGEKYSMTESTYIELKNTLTVDMLDFALAIMFVFSNLEYYKMVNDVYEECGFFTIPRRLGFIHIVEHDISLKDYTKGYSIFDSVRKQYVSGTSGCKEIELSNNGLLSNALRYIDLVSGFSFLSKPIFAITDTFTNKEMQKIFASSGNTKEANRILELLNKGYNESIEPSLGLSFIERQLFGNLYHNI
jgi:hypothetical protein